ncbi:HAMP domain-containing sensor histidine kinase [Chroococcidiopsis sp. CCMEE 29]|uniref:sensor histidine kinase n=1 Tax=Chroococcidiopsis sp. CCMEE 29 TaxID=155894 RepID=UPI002022914C|nr:HAMP domain-containing sensor histidine kinase [Chroococcidiopsis sp. CCMEE 29]
MPVSSEFISLCRSQVTLLTQGLGAALSIVYLTERLVEEGTAQDKLIPVVAYPETAIVWEGSDALSLLPAEMGNNSVPRLLSEPTPETASVTVPVSLAEFFTDAANEYQPEESNRSIMPNRQIVLPLMHEEVLIGLLVTGREDRAWNEQERSEIERIAQTLTLAGLLDRRREWCEQQLIRQQRLQAKQRDLLDNLLHQFRNPLTALRTFGKLLLKRLIPGDANRTVADNIVRESDRLQELLQQFDQVIDLTVDDLEPRKSLPPASFMEVTVQPVNPPLPLLPNGEGSAEVCSVADVLKPLLASAGAIAQERNLNLQADIPSNLPPVGANAKELREVLSNLIDNALKYTPAGGEIYIQAGLKQGHFQGIAISDTGLGIPPEDLEHIFERHYRGVQADSEIPGTGLGLAIAKDLVEQMQGEVQVFSPAQRNTSAVAGGPGSTFIVWLPVFEQEE